jgi:hypothetical protein
MVVIDVGLHIQEEPITHMTMLTFHGQYYIVGKVKTEFEYISLCAICAMPPQHAK